MEKYYISISGDDYRSGEVFLTDAEICAFRKVVDALKPEGPYAPTIAIINRTEEARERARAAQEAAEKAEAEARAERLRDTRSVWQAAFANAGKIKR